MADETLPSVCVTRGLSVPVERVSQPGRRLRFFRNGASRATRPTRASVATFATKRIKVTQRIWSTAPIRFSSIPG
jgi:hypothetical protein